MKKLDSKLLVSRLLDPTFHEKVKRKVEEKTKHLFTRSDFYVPRVKTESNIEEDEE